MSLFGYMKREARQAFWNARRERKRERTTFPNPLTRQLVRQNERLLKKGRTIFRHTVEK